MTVLLLALASEEHALCRWRVIVLGPRQSLAQCHRHGFERSLNFVVCVDSTDHIDVHSHLESGSKRLKNVWYHLARKVSNLFERAQIADKMGRTPARDVHHNPGQGLVERAVGRAKPGDALPLSQGLIN